MENYASKRERRPVHWTLLSVISATLAALLVHSLLIATRPCEGYDVVGNHELKAGDLLLFRTLSQRRSIWKKLLLFLTRWVDEFDHIGLIFEKDDGLYVYEKSGRRVRQSGLERRISGWSGVLGVLRRKERLPHRHSMRLSYLCNLRSNTAVACSSPMRIVRYYLDPTHVPRSPATCSDHIHDAFDQIEIPFDMEGIFPTIYHAETTHYDRLRILPRRVQNVG